MRFGYYLGIILLSFQTACFAAMPSNATDRLYQSYVETSTGDTAVRVKLSPDSWTALNALYVTYTGAPYDVDLGTHSLTAGKGTFGLTSKTILGNISATTIQEWRNPSDEIVYAVYWTGQMTSSPALMSTLPTGFADTIYGFDGTASFVSGGGFFGQHGLGLFPNADNPQGNVKYGDIFVLDLELASRTMNYLTFIDSSEKTVFSVDASANLLVGGNATIGSGAAGVDYTLTFDGESADGVITFMEDEDYFAFADKVKFTAPVGLGMAPITNYPLVVQGSSVTSGHFYQGADSAGIFLYGYDDHSTDYLAFSVSSAGDGAFSVTGHNMLFSVTTASKYIYFISKNDFYFDLGDALGARKFNFRNSSGAIKATIDSLGKIISNNITTGLGVADTDYTHTFDGESGDFVWKWWEDELYLEAQNNLLLNTNKIFYFRDTAIGVYSQADTFLDIFADGGLRIGDSSAGAPTNYAKFAADGELTLVGTARVKREEAIMAVNTVKGASAPTTSTIQIGTTTTMLSAALSFSKVTQEEVYFAYHVPEDNDDTVNLTFHLMWKPGALWTTGNYMWKLEYIVKNESDDSTTGASTTIQADVTPANATNFIETEFASTIDAHAQQTIICHFYRDVANDNADDVGRIRFFEFERTVNKLGEAT